MLTVWTVARVTALGRVALAFSLLFLSMTEAGEYGFESEPDDLAAASYLVLALGLAAVAWRSWWWDFKLQPWALAADVLTFIVQPSLLHPEHDGYRIAALTLATFILLSSALRWNWRLAAMVAVALNLSSVFLQYFHPIDFAAHVHSERSHLRSSYFLLIISLLIVWVGSRVGGPRPAPFRSSDALFDQPGTLKEALEFALGSTRARSGSICWRDANDRNCGIVVVRQEGNSSDCNSFGCTDYDFASDDQGILFDLDAHRCVVLGSGGHLKSVSGQSWVPSPAIECSGFRKGAVVPMQGGNGRGLLFVSGCQLLSIDLLRFLTGVGEEVAAEFNRSRSAKMAREEELGRLRNALARDLHDSVVQSIAGTRYWLNSLKLPSPSGNDLQNELRRIDEALGKEAIHLRTTIEKLRAGSFAPVKGGGAADLQGFVAALADQWRIEFTLDVPDRVDLISRDLSFEMNQVIREAVSNAVRHGSASQVAIRLSIEGDRLLLVIKDNGRGFPDNGDYGKPRMLEARAQELMGRLTLETGAQGTTVTLELPMESDH